MHHNLCAGARKFGSCDRAFERFKAIFADDAGALADLQAEHDVRIFRDRFRRQTDVGVVD